jgi:cyclopropane fatty-acyl-phospholipid synthase-like methyltransferase
MLRRLFFQYSYFRQPPWDTGISPPELFEFIENHLPGRAIDIGCGTGTNVITLAQAGWQVVGIDFAPRAIRLARRKIKAAGVQAELQVNDATKLKGIHGPFDLALDLGCFHGITPAGRIRYVQQLERILVPGGSWLMYGFIKPDAGGSSSGLAETDIQRICSTMKLISRQEGFDDKRGRSSAWFLFKKEFMPAGAE